MEKLQKDDELSDDLDLLRNYGFNIDELLEKIAEDGNEEEKDR